MVDGGKIFRRLAEALEGETWLQTARPAQLPPPGCPRTRLGYLSEAQRKNKVAVAPSAVRTMCNLPHFSISSRLF